MREPIILKDNLELKNLVKELSLKAFPDYKGRKFYLIKQDVIDTNYNANWSGGTRTEYKFMRTDTKAILTLPDIAPWNRNYRDGSGEAKLIPGIICITHTIFCGKDVGLSIYFNDNLPESDVKCFSCKFMPKPPACIFHERCLNYEHFKRRTILIQEKL